MSHTDLMIRVAATDSTFAHAAAIAPNQSVTMRCFNGFWRSGAVAGERRMWVVNLSHE